MVQRVFLNDAGQEVPIDENDQPIDGPAFDPAQLQGVGVCGETDGVLDSHGFTKEQVDQQHAETITLLQWQHQELSARSNMWNAVGNFFNAGASIVAVIQPHLQEVVAAVAAKAMEEINKEQ